MEKIASLEKLQDGFERIDIVDDYRYVQDLITELHFAYEQFRFGRDVSSLSDPRLLWDAAYYLLTALTNPHRRLSLDPAQEEDGLAISGLTFELLGRHAEINGDSDVRRDCLLNAAICNSLSRYEANAAVLADAYFAENKNLPIEKADFLHNPAGHGMNVVFALLARKFFWIRKNRSRAVTLSDISSEAITSSPSGVRSRGATYWSLVCRAAFRLADFMVDGEEKAYEATLKDLELAREFTLEQDMLSEHWLASRLIDCAKRMADHSTWRRLREQGFSADYVSALTSLPWNSVHELWQSQVDALTELRTPSHPEVTNFLSEGAKRVLISMPTSAGKTLSAEMAVVRTLESKPGSKCVYVVPTRALVDEVESKLHRRLRFLEYRVASVIGGFELDIGDPAYLEENVDVAVLTPEKLDYLFRRQDPFIDHIELMIFDEVHKVGEGYRGWLLETLLSWLLLKPGLSKTKMIFMSAVLPRSQLPLVRMWIGGQESAPAVTSQWSPTRQVIGVLWYSDLRPDWDNPIAWDDQGNRCYFGSSANLTFRYDIGTSNRTLADLYKLRFWVNDQYKRVRPSFDRETRYDRCFRVIKTLASDDFILVYFQTKVDLIRFCRRAPEYLSPLEDDRLDRLEHYLSTRLGSSPLLECLPYGVAFHHGDLPLDVRNEIEQAYRDKTIRILACTTTLAEGVNLPVQTFILGYHQTFNKYRLSVRDFKNIIGRAGRALVQTEGHIIAIRHPEFLRENEDSSYFDSLLNLDETQLTIRSGFPPADYSDDESKIIAELNALTEAVKDLQSLAEMEYIEDLADELQRLQVLIFTLFEDGIVDATPESVKEALQATLLFTQASSARMQEAVVGLSQAFLHLCAQMNSARLRRFNASGLHYRSNHRLEELASDVCTRCAGLEPADYTFETVIAREGLEFILQDIREARPRDSEYRSREHEVIQKLDHYEALVDWLDGASFAQIRDKYFAPISNVAQRTEVCQSYISKQFVFRLPWVLSGLQIHAEQMADSTLNFWLKTLPAQVKYGVDTPEAVYLSSIGVRSRFLSIALAQLYREDHGVVSEFDWEPLGKWFRSLSPFYLRRRLPDLPELAIRQAVRRANTIRPPSKALRRSRRVTFNVAGWRHYDGEAVVDRLREQVWRAEKPAVQLRLEARNLYDEYAVEIYWVENKLGYVPRSNNEEIALLLALGRALQAKLMTIGSRQPSGWRPVEVMVELL